MAGWNYGALLSYPSQEQVILKSPIDEIFDMLFLTDEELASLDNMMQFYAK